jgi:hypothetical protein
MVHAARATTASATAPPSPRHLLINVTAIRIARNSPENNTLNFSNRPENACFGARPSRVSRTRHHESPVAGCGSRFTNHQSPPTNHAMLIATQLLNISVTRSQQTRKHFLIDTKYDTFAPAAHRKNCLPIFLTATDPNSENCQSPENKREKIFLPQQKKHCGKGLSAAAGTLACLPQAVLCNWRRRSRITNHCSPITTHKLFEDVTTPRSAYAT